MLTGIVSLLSIIAMGIVAYVYFFLKGKNVPYQLEFVIKIGNILKNKFKLNDTMVGVVLILIIVFITQILYMLISHFYISSTQKQILEEYKNTVKLYK